MAHFYGTLDGARGPATRCGTKTSGMRVVCASWDGAVKSTAYVNSEGVDCVCVEKILWGGVGEIRLLYDGPIGKAKEN